MTLDELEASSTLDQTEEADVEYIDIDNFQIVKEIKKEAAKEDKEEEFDDDDTEANLSNALSLLQDVASLLGHLANPSINFKVSKDLKTVITDLGAEINAFIEDFDVEIENGSSL